jgi:hypothetical protein
MRRSIVAGALAAAATLGTFPWAAEVRAAGPGACPEGFHPVSVRWKGGALASVDENGNGFFCLRKSGTTFQAQDDQP